MATEHLHKLEEDGSLLGNGVSHGNGPLEEGEEAVVGGEVTLEEDTEQLEEGVHILRVVPGDSRGGGGGKGEGRGRQKRRGRRRGRKIGRRRRRRRGRRRREEEGEEEEEEGEEEEEEEREREEGEEGGAGGKRARIHVRMYEQS